MLRIPMNYDNTGVTIELREMVENGVNIWAFDYPSYYKGAEKEAFEKKVTDHYYFRQIGQETPGRWLHYFRTRMREIMPYYIQLYKSVELMEAQENPFQSYDLTEEYIEERSDTGTTSGRTTNQVDAEKTTENSGTNSNTVSAEKTDTRTGSDSRNVEKNGTDLSLISNTEQRKFSDTPQGEIANIENYLTDYTETIKSGSDNKTLEASETNAGEHSETGTETGSEESTGTHSETGSESASETTSGTSEVDTTSEGNMKYTLTRKGNIGVQPLGQEVKALREAFINVDMMIINELKDLFLQVY